MSYSFQNESALGLGQRVKSGTIWAFLGSASSQILSLITTIVLARLLSPQDFGVVAIAMVVWGLIQLFGSMGIGAKVIQQPDDIERYASAAFWLNVLVAMCLSLSTILIAPFAAKFYENALVSPILMILGLGFFLNSFGIIHTVLLVKELDFKKRTIVDISIYSITRVITIVMAFMGYGVWSLVIPNVLSSPIRVITLWKICPWRPKLEFNFYYWKSIFHFGKYILGTDLFRYMNLNGDYLIIGKFLGSFELGLYTFAYKLANFPFQNVLGVVPHVIYPTFSKLQNDLNRLREVFLKITELLSLIAFPLFIGLLAMANELIPVVFGEKWDRAIVPLQIIIGFALISSFVSPCGQIVTALGKPNIEFKFNLIQFPLLLIGILIGMSYGITGVAIGMALVIGTMAFVFLGISIGLINLSLTTFFRVLFPALVSSLLMLLLLILLRYLLIDYGYKKYEILLVCIPFGAVIYFSALLAFFRGSVQMLWTELVDVFAGRIMSVRKVYAQNS